MFLRMHSRNATDEDRGVVEQPAAVRDSLRASALAAGCLIALAALARMTPDARGEDASSKAETAAPTPDDLITPKTQRAIDSGLVDLASRQHADGSFGSGRDYERNVAVTSLCGMAFLAAGHTPQRGKYGRNVQKAVEFILSRVRPNGYINDETSSTHGPMYGHGFATMFLAETYGMTPSPDIRKKLDSAVNLIINTQNKEGGWRYQPTPKDADISVTVCQMMALRAARNCGIFVPKATVEKCVEYVKRCQNSDGGFRYQLNSRRDSAFARSAAGVVALYSAGVYQGSEIESGLNFLMRHVPRGGGFSSPRNYYYGHYYAVQAMWHARGDHWQTWYPAIRDELLQRQSPGGGGWPERSICTEYSTAMACLILQVPNNHLPIFQR